MTDTTSSLNQERDPIRKAARAIWDWEHEGRNNEILEIEWSLLCRDYEEKAEAAINAYKECL